MALKRPGTEDKKEGGGERKPDEGLHRFIPPDEIKPHAEALGTMVIIFSGLELHTSILLNVMLGIEFTAKGDAMGGLELNPKLRLLKSLGFVVGKDLPNNWWQRLSDLLNTLEKLCGERNRMVHDVWGLSEGQLIRITQKPKIAKQPLEMKVEEISVSVRDIQNLSYRIFDATGQIHALAIELKPSLKK